jgi:hypothetical protein
MDMLKREPSHEFSEAAANYLNEMKLRERELISAELGEGNKGSSYVLRKPFKKGVKS